MAPILDNAGKRINSETTMKRRDFIAAAGSSMLAAALHTGCSSTGPLPDSRSIVDTPEKRADYLARMLKELCTDLGPRSPDLYTG